MWFARLRVRVCLYALYVCARLFVCMSTSPVAACLVGGLFACAFVFVCVCLFGCVFVSL